MDPFTEVTIASAAMRTWKHKFLEPNEIAYFPHNVTPHLQDSIRWLEFLRFSEGLDIRHARNTSVAIMVAGFEVTGVLIGPTPDTTILYEFSDCKLDGCPNCTRNRIYFFRRKQQKMCQLRTLGYQVVEMWSCMFYDLRITQAFRDFKKAGVTWNEPLNPRHAFYGGRTNAVTLYRKCVPGEEEEIKYVDYTSLYPWTNKYCLYPLGHPDIILNPSLDRLLARDYFGVAKCCVVPPRRLYHPVLPMRFAGKLMFALCRSCMHDNADRALDAEPFDGICKHEDSERAFEGTWCTPEIYRAMDLGYVVKAVREVHHFPRFRKGLFEDYVNTFLKAKQEASGWPQVMNLWFYCTLYLHQSITLKIIHIIISLLLHFSFFRRILGILENFRLIVIVFGTRFDSRINHCAHNRVHHVELMKFILINCPL